MKHPQRGVGRVVLRRLAAVGKAIGQHAAIDEAGVGPQDAGREVVAPQRRREAGQGNHGVAAPVGEPGIARNDARRRGAGLAAAHDELIRGLRQRANPRRRGLRQARGQALRSRFQGIEDVRARSRRRGLGGGHQDTPAGSGLKSAVKVPGINKSSAASRPRSASTRCQKFQYHCGRRGEPALTDRQSVGPGAGKGLHPALLGIRLEFEGLGSAVVAVIVAIREQGFERHAQRRRRTQQFQAQVAGVGSRRHENPLFEQRVGHRIAPGRDAVPHARRIPSERSPAR